MYVFIFTMNKCTRDCSEADIKDGLITGEELMLIAPEDVKQSRHEKAYGNRFPEPNNFLTLF